jgi:hypothetical protein
LVGLVAASAKTKRPRLDRTIDDMEASLAVTLERESAGMQTSDASLGAWQAMEARWAAEWAPQYEPLLKRWLQAQLAVALFPFGGFGASLSERVSIIGVRFATLKLALMSACQQQGGVLAEDEAVRVVQSLARFMDHLADPALSIQIYTETGWLRESRLRALVGDY